MGKYRRIDLDARRRWKASYGRQKLNMSGEE
jgi:hypothetical protein